MSLFREALRSLTRARLRSALTALGVVFGVAAVVATISIGIGARENIARVLATVDSRTIYVAAIPRRSNDAPTLQQLGASDRLQSSDYYEILRRVQHIAAASRFIDVRDVRARSRGRAAMVTVYGMDSAGFEIHWRKLVAGALFGDVDVARASSACVVSNSLGHWFFGMDSPIGRVIEINSKAFTVVGVVDDERASLEGVTSRENFHVYVPISTALKHFSPNGSISFGVLVDSAERVLPVQDAVYDLMEVRRSGRRSDFLVTTDLPALKTYADGDLSVAKLLGVLGIVSLVVGGIGIMNVMLANVTERTREIGIMVAVGTRGIDIFIRFLLEATILSAIGGVAGLVVGSVGAVICAKVNNWPISISASSVFAALLCSVAVGVLAGTQPARRAAAMDPILAIRNEMS